MTCANDKAEVARLVPIELQNAKLVLGAGITVTTDYLTRLPDLTSKGAVAEAQRLRDHMQELREELDRYQY